MFRLSLVIIVLPRHLPGSIPACRRDRLRALLDAPGPVAYEMDDIVEDRRAS